MEKPQTVDVNSVNWDAGDPWTWTDLLIKQPQLADKCDRKVWNKFSADNWVVLLSEVPQLAAYCTWSKLDMFDWCLLYAKQPELVKKHWRSKIKLWSIKFRTAVSSDLKKFPVMLDKYNNFA